VRLKILKLRAISIISRTACLRVALIAAGLAAAAPAAWALGNDTLFLRADANATYNSNVLGISNQLPPTLAEQLLGGRRQGDWIIGYGAGLRLDLPVSRQRFQLDASATWYRYNQYSDLNYTGYAVRGIWNWRAGNDWYGQINAGAAQSRQPNTTGIGINPPILVKNYDELVDVHYALTPRWEFNGALNAAQARYDAAAFQSGDFNMTAQSIGATYRTPSGNGTGVRLTFEQGEWPNQPPVGTALLDNRYTQYTLAMVFDWRLTGRSQLSGNVGYTARTRSTVGQSNRVDGPSGQIDYTYSLGGKSRIQASLYQTFGPLNDPTATYAQTTGLNLGYAYQATAKLGLQANASWQQIAYLGESLIPDSAQRRDTYATFGLGAKYQATRTLAFSVGAQYQNRDSNIPLAAYDVYIVYLNVNIEF
jgi:exopolysaccharide biosynthesis operon protein EpsL